MTHPARLWDETAQAAATKARNLRWLVLAIFIGAAVLIYVNNYFGPVLLPLFERLVTSTPHSDAENLALWRQMQIALINSGPLIALAWGLWSANAFLKRVEAGELLAAGSMRLFARIGDALWATALWLGLLAPTLTAWVQAEGPYDFKVDPLILSLAGLGIALSAIAHVFEDIVRGAEKLKADAEEIV